MRVGNTWSGRRAVRTCVSVAIAGAWLAGAAPLAGQQQAQTPEGYPAAGEPPVVRLLSNGAEPRRALRLKLTEGDVSRIEMRMNMAMSVAMGGMSMPAPALPAMRMVVETRVTEVAGDRISYALEFVESGLVDEQGTDPAIAAQMRGTTDRMRGIKGTGTISDRGLPIASDMDLSAVADPQMRQAIGNAGSVEQWVAALPEEPVGIGARWETLNRMPNEVMTLFQRTEIEITGIDGDRVSLKATITQQAPSQDIALPQLPPEAQAWLESYTANGSGTTDMNLTRLSASGTSSVDSSMAMGFAMGGMEQAMTMGMKISMEVKPLEGSGGG